MAKKELIFLLVAVLVLFSAPVFAGPDMQEGLWEVTLVFEMNGSSMLMPPQKHTQCLSKADMVPKDPKAPQNCNIIEQRIDGNTVDWIMECSEGDMKTVSKGSIVYGGDSFSGRMDVDIDGTSMKLVSTMTGRRLGPCK